MSAKVEAHSQMTQRGHSVTTGGGGTRIPVAVRPTQRSPSSTSADTPSSSLPSPPQPEQQQTTAAVPLEPPSSESSSQSSALPSSEHSTLPPPPPPPSSSPSSQSQQQPSSLVPSSSSQSSTTAASSSSQTAPAVPPGPLLPSPSPSSSQHPMPPPPVQPLALPSSSSSSSPPETEREGGGLRRRKTRLRKEGSPGTVWTPEALPTTRSGPPPEDRLSGANTARPAASTQSTARTEPGSKPEMLSMTVRASLQPRVYCEGMQYMRDRIQEIIDDLHRIQCQYHHTEVVDEDFFVDYLKACDRHFLRANTELRKRSIDLEVIDSETRLVSLLNRLREQESCDPETVQYLTEYWENIKDTVESLKAVVSKFQTKVLNRLKRNYISDSSADAATHLEVCSSFTADISTHMADLENTLSNTQILLKSFHSGLHQHLFDKSSFGDLLVVSCDLKAFPLLRLVADVAGKVGKICEVAHLWLVRDEQFMREIQSFIREARQRARQREEDLKSQKEKQKKYVKSVKAAHILLHNNRDKLSRIETELRVLEEQMNESARDKQHHYDQLQQKESMVDFLQITLSQTKRNYTLQATRVKLSRQVKDLKEVLGSMERDLDAIQTEIQVKAEEKVRLSERVEHHERSYDALRCDMDRFSSCVEQLQSEVTDLSGQLLQLEIIHNLKTSPEKVEEIYDRPSTVKLAPSLKEKIRERKKRIKPK